MDHLGITSVAAITAICYLLASGLKAAGLNKKWLPTLCSAMGGVLGPVGLSIMPSFPAPDFLTAVAVGIVSGLAATGGYEAVHQFRKDKKEESE